MPHLFIILLKINLVLLLFAATYYLVLRRLTFYMLNRCFLALGIVFSTAYPFIDLTEFFHRQEIQNNVATYLPQLNQTASELVPSGFFINNWPILSALFYLGVLFMTVRLAVQFVSLYKIHRKSKPGTIADYDVRLLDDSVSPFSFWQTVYVNPTLHSDKELDTILAHEMVHVKQWHSLDIILAELSVVFYWFNPGVWLMKKAVKENLEFITDQNILKRGMDRKVYQYSLLGVGQLTPSAAIVNNFNLSDLKKRIQMMNAKRSSKLTLSRYLFALPVLLMTTLAFTVSKKDLKKHLPILSKMVHVAEQKETVMPAPVVNNAKVYPKKSVTKKQAPEKPMADTVSKRDFFAANILIKRDSLNKHSLLDIDELFATIKGRLNLPENAKPVQGKGKITKEVFFVKTDSSATDKVSGIKNVSIRFTQTGKAPSLPAPDDGKIIMVRAFKLNDTTSTSIAGKVDYVINGKIARSADLNDLKGNDIQHVQVIKGTADSNPQIRIETKKRTEL